MKFFLVALVLTICLVKISQSGEYLKADGRTYYLSYPVTRNWYQANRFCSRNGMYLLNIRTEAENVRVRGLIDKFIKKQNITAGGLLFWTSGTDLGSEGRYYWMTTGEELLYSDWVRGAPDNWYSESNKETDNCLILQGHWQFQWSDVQCLTSYPFICRDTYDMPIFKTNMCSNSHGEL